MKKYLFFLLMLFPLSYSALAGDCEDKVDMLERAENIDAFVAVVRCLDKRLDEKDSELRVVNKKLEYFDSCEICVEDKIFSVSCAPINDWTGWTNDNRKTSDGTPKRFIIKCRN